jgi:hypothetical protein
MSVTALPGTVLSIRLGSPERIGRLSIPDEASLSGLGVHSRSGPKAIWHRRQPTLINLTIKRRILGRRFNDRRRALKICEGGPACL